MWSRIHVLELSYRQVKISFQQIIIPILSFPFLAVIGGAVVGLLCAILVVMFIVYRMRKKDEGSYPLEEMKRCPAYNPYMKPTHREFFA